jgi:hypothetical protein
MRIARFELDGVVRAGAVDGDRVRPFASGVGVYDLLLARQAQVQSFQDWSSGKSGPIDVRNMPGAGPALDLYTQARASHDAGRIGRGFGTMAAGTNPNYVASLEKENQLERDLSAAGALEGNVNQAVAQNTGEGYNLSNMLNTQNMGIAGIQTGREGSSSDRYLNFLERPRPPSFLKQLALQAVGGASQMASAYLTGGLSAARKPATAGAGGGGGIWP